MRGVRQRRPSSKVKRHRDTRSLELRDGMVFSLEFSFGFGDGTEHRLKPVPRKVKRRQDAGGTTWVEKENAPPDGEAHFSTS